LPRKLIFAAILIGVSISCTKHQAEPSAPTASSSPAVSQARNSVDVVKVNTAMTEIQRGKTADATVELTIEKGYHVNANPPTFAYLKPTELEFGQTPGVSVSFIVYPDPLTKSFPFAEKPLAVYEATTTLKVKLKADKSALVGTQNLSGKLRVQACDDQVCYAPGTLAIALPLTIK
jgi:hypothetical protein